MSALVEALRSAGVGTVSLPADPGWESARLTFHAQRPLEPMCVVEPSTPAQVAEIVRVVAAHGARVAVVSTGHKAMALPDLDDVVLLRTGGLLGVSVDVEAGLARIAAGERWGQVLPVLAEHGVTFPAGTSPDVGVVGFTTGGGIGWLSARYGFACNRIESVDIVTGTGAEAHIDIGDPELFWALRGGGGIGVITAITLRTVPLAPLEGGSLFFEADRFEEVLAAWRDWSTTLDESVTTGFRLVSFPPAPFAPDDIAGRRLVLLDVVVHDNAGHLGDVLAPLRALGPIKEEISALTLEGLLALHGDPRESVKAFANHVVLEELPDEAVSALHSALSGRGTASLAFFEVRRLNGAMATASADSGVFGASPHPFMTSGVVLGGGAADDAQALLAAADDALHPWAATHRLFNFVEERAPLSWFFDDETTDRLRSVHTRVDPRGVILATHPIA